MVCGVCVVRRGVGVCGVSKYVCEARSRCVCIVWCGVWVHVVSEYA